MTHLDDFIDAGQLAGAATMAWRRGKGEPAVTCAGVRDLATGLPVQRDTIFRIASMTKPITSTLALMLYEEGKLSLDDPITRYAPEFSNMRVLPTPDAPLESTQPADRPITFDDLLTHRSGITYGDFHTGPIAAAYAEALGKHIDNELSPYEWIARLATLPLIDQPGSAFHYGHSTDLLGFLIARIEDAPLEEVLQRRIFGPLGMLDTGFAVDKVKLLRRAGLCGFDDAARLIPLTNTPGDHALGERPEGMTFVSGGQGLWSTLDDFLAFARMFIQEGTVDGVRLLRPETLRLMTSNRLTGEQRKNSRMFGRPLFNIGHGYGMGVAVVMEPDQADVTKCGGAAGAVGWPGGYGSWWQADPCDGSVLIFLSHNMVELQQMARGIGLEVWSAIVQFQTASAASNVSC